VNPIIPCSHGRNKSRSALGVFAVLAALVSTAVWAASDNAESPRQDVTQMVLMMDGPRDKNCTERKVVKTEVVAARVEHWTLDRCGKLVNYRVRFSTNSKGGTDFDVQLEK
jgi:hypothetical protein